MGKYRTSCISLLLACCASINIFVGATSIVPFFSDRSCQDSTFTGQTDQQAFSGACHPVLQEANSVDPSHLDSCCAVTVYTDPDCSEDAKLAPNGTCTPLRIGSYSVDCPCFPSTSPQSASGAATSTPSSSSSTSTSSSSVSPTSEHFPTTSSSSSVATAISSSLTTSSTEDISTDTATARPSDLPLLTSSSSRSSARSSSTSAASKGGGSNGGGNNLSVSAQISLGVILPSLSLIAAVIFGVRKWRRE
ncbi:hypothetical protein HO173_012597 [Letharia columbiana]|uniref:Uncharacterized protein n=1 Tax=Letharia columbiana TaxID=112416 RepID=A0A8H6CM22_9LECA|nr:uncharacterized protein HO173_012597 [Letharia columbiana]KAF6226007.1 hypothetical protein HO173_012597 [Letharia columbiana]